MKTEIIINSKSKYTSFMNIISEITKRTDKKDISEWLIFSSLNKLGNELFSKTIKSEFNKTTVVLDSLQTLLLYIVLKDNELPLDDREKAVSRHILKAIEKEYYKQRTNYINVTNFISGFNNFKGV